MRWVFALVALYRSCLPDPAAWEFTRAQEEWVAEARPAECRGAIPGCVEDLGLPRYADRLAAERRVVVMRAVALPGLVWAARLHRDPHVRWRAGVLVDRLYRCPYCLGDGACPRCHGQPHTDCPCWIRRACARCTGSGDVRLEFMVTAYVGGQSTPLYRPRELYGNPCNR